MITALIVIQVYYCNNFITISCCYGSELKYCEYQLKTDDMLIMSAWAVHFSSKLYIIVKMLSLTVLVYFSWCLVQYYTPWMIPIDTYEVPLVMLKALPRSREKSCYYNKNLSCLICIIEGGLQMHLLTISR